MVDDKAKEKAVALDTLRTALGLPVSVIADDVLTDILASCEEVQRAYIDVPVYGPALRQALIRRVGRAVTARGIPLGAQNTEFGTMYVPQFDPILQELEAPFRPPVVS